MSEPDVQQKNQRTLILVLILVGAMLGLAFASVPLYRLFCQITGYGGTTQVAQAFPEEIVDREMKIFFDARISPQLEWEFEPEIRHASLKLGEKGITNYIAFNPTDKPLFGTAIYNVTPSKAGQYFHKVQCFCFQEQLLNPDQRVNMPLLYFVDPALNDDPELDDVTSITLTYTFFKAESEAYDEAMDEYLERPDEAISPMGVPIVNE